MQYLPVWFTLRKDVSRHQKVALRWLPTPYDTTILADVFFFGHHLFTLGDLLDKPWLQRGVSLPPPSVPRYVSCFFYR